MEYGIFWAYRYQLKQCESEVAKIEKLGDDRTLDESELSKLHELQAHCNKWRVRKAQLFRQYSRVQKLTLKNHNSRYFRIVTSINKSITRSLEW